MKPSDTVLPLAAEGVSLGAIVHSGIRMLYAIPCGKPTLEAIAFPGDHVAWPFWATLPGAPPGQHPHSAGMLGTLHRKMTAAGGIYSKAAI